MEQQKSLAVVGHTSVPAFVENEMASLQSALDYASMLLKSRMCPAHFYGKKTEKDNKGYDREVVDYEAGRPEAVLLVLQHGREVGLSYMQALQQIVPVNGLVSIKGDGAKALIMASGNCSDWKEEYVGEPYTDDYGCKITAARKGGQSSSVTFTVAKAKRAGLWVSKEAVERTPGLKFGAWYKYPDRMLRYRALGFIARDLFADVLQGISITEEAADIEVDNTRVVTDDGLTIDHSKVEKSQEMTQAAKKKSGPASTVKIPKYEVVKGEDNYALAANVEDAKVVEEDFAPEEKASSKKNLMDGVDKLERKELWQRVQDNLEFDGMLIWTGEHKRTPLKVIAILQAIQDGNLESHLKETYSFDMKAAIAQAKGEDPVAEDPMPGAQLKEVPLHILDVEAGRDIVAATAVADLLEENGIESSEALTKKMGAPSDLDEFCYSATRAQIAKAIS